jgi:HrpA-like RNA helicase
MLHLPIVPFLKKISNLVEQKSVTIVATPTGSGKTIWVPAFIQSETSSKVYVTVPRVLLAKSARNAVSKFILGREHLVGMMTGKGDKFPNAQLQYCTEGSFALRAKLNKNDILIVDEVHEQGINTEEILFIARHHVAQGGKAILMSATMDVHKYKTYFEQSGSVGVFEMDEPKRPFETKIITIDNPLEYILQTGGRWLVGVGGKSDIEEIKNKLLIQGYKGKIFPLHSEIEEWEEETALSYKGECIFISTSVGMSGITFPSLDGVLVPEYGKRVEDSTLISYQLSTAEQKQWEGRVGRTKNGIAIYDKAFASKDREANVTPEIIRTPVKNVTLTFAAKGFDLETAVLLNKPSLDAIKKSKEELVSLNLLSSSDNNITEKGIWVYKSGLGVDGGCLAFAGKNIGIEKTARKIAALIEEGSPYRKGVTKFGKELQKICEICKISDHYRIIRMIEEDIEQHFGNGNVAELVKKYGEENNIFLKGVNRLLKTFSQIDQYWSDQVNPTTDLIKNLFSEQSPKFTFENGWNQEFGRITRGYGSMVDPTCKKCYATVSPISCRGGRIVEMVTDISQ